MNDDREGEKVTGEFQQAKNSRLWVPEIEKIFHQQFLGIHRAVGIQSCGNIELWEHRAVRT